MKSKTKSASVLIKRLQDALSAYSFNMYCMKGKDTTLSFFPD